MKLIVSCIISLAVAVGCQCFDTIDQWMQWSHDLFLTRKFINSTCYHQTNNTLKSLRPATNVTIFAASNDAWAKTFKIRDLDELQNLSCSMTPHNLTSNCFELFANSTTQRRIQDFEPCLDQLPFYHIASGLYDELWAYGNATMNVTVVPTLLQTMNHTQVLVVNTTGRGETFVQGGGNSTARIINTYPAKDGQIYVIDRVLAPPMPLNYTLISLQSESMRNRAMIDAQAFNQTSIFNQTLAQIESGYGNFTIFLPENITDFSHVNVTRYAVPQLIYLNETQPRTLNLTTFSGNDFILEIGQNYTAMINSNVTVTRKNIPLQNGVLHLLNSTIAGQGSLNNTMAARSLRFNWEAWRNLLANG